MIKNAKKFLRPELAISLFVMLLGSGMMNVKADINLAAFVNSGQFDPYLTFSTGGPAYATGIGDFNNDGRLDIAVTTRTASSPYTYYLYVFLQKLDGTLDTPATYLSGMRPESIAIGDINNDGLDDVAVGFFSENKVGVFLQNLSGTLDNYVPYNTNTGLYGVKIGDVNNDGLEDLVVSHWTASNIGVLLQQIDGTLGPLVPYTAPQAGYDEIDVGDVNNDGLLDVIKMNGQGLNPDLSVYLQNIGKTLDTAVSYYVGDRILTHGEAVGDVTGDGLDDVVVVYGGNTGSSNPGKVGVFKQNLAGTLNPVVTYSAYDIPEAVEIADVNQDGRNDVVVIHGGWMAVGIFIQTSEGTLSPYELYDIPYASHYNPQGIAVGDFTGDGYPDIAIADSNSGLVVLEHAAPVPDQIIVNGGSPQLAQLGTAFADPLTVVVLDQFGNPLSGVTVTFTAPGSSASGIFTDSGNNITTVDTGVDGVATSTVFTANFTEGSYIVSATVSGFGSSANFELTNFSPPASFAKLSPLDGATYQITGPTLIWESSVGATSYEYCIDIIDDNVCNNSWIDTGGSTNKILSGLNNGTTYYWHVRAKNIYDVTYSEGDSTAFWSFTTVPTPLLDFNGGVEVLADQPIIVIGRPHIGAEIMAYNGASAGANTVYLPMLFNNKWGYTSSFTVQNTGTSAASFSITLKDAADGSTSCTLLGQNLPQHGVKTYDVTNLGECDGGGALPIDWFGGATLVSDQPLVVVTRANINGSDAVMYNGFNGGVATTYLPMLFRGKWGYQSAFYVQNLDASLDANITIEFYDTAGAYTCTYVDPVPFGPSVTRGYWMAGINNSDQCLGSTGFDSLGWTGSAVITSTGSASIVAIGRPHLGTEVAAYNGFSSGGTINYLPMLFRGKWGYNSAFYIQNISGSDTSIAVTFYDIAGNEVCTYTDPTALGAKVTRGYWTPSLNCNDGRDFDPAGWAGSAKIVTSQAVIADGRPHLSDGQVVVYNALTDGATSAYVPMTFRQYGGSETALYIQNLGTVQTTATINYYDEESGFYCVMEQVVEPGASGAIWLAGLDSSVCVP